ncbi:linear gramicidin synthetase subunit D domain protein [Mycobacterium xenopi 4042]|uniref:Linear gramicidin synthetase subunit D domain protein n=1 Tax=Mycobacterium xenopi 4042 TaxID=1299334 RepID=X8E7I6_MYCXE|nr:linear gramicidin synthetase subunit D domain protein [Mycobacterium xenopi 4042]
MIKRAKEQLRALPDPLTYGVLRYLNDDVDIAESTRRSGSTTWAGWVPRGVCIR